MTDRQEKFCIEFSRCGNATEAYKAAGYKPTSDAAARAHAARLVANGSVQERIAELRGKAEDEKIMDAKERRIILSEIAKSGKPIVAIKAIDTLNKMDGVYIQKTQLSGSVDTGDIVIRFSDEVPGDGA